MSATLEESIEVKRSLVAEGVPAIVAAAELIGDALVKGAKLLIVGNGGSAADAQHVAAELVGRFQLERRALPAIALTTDSSVLTSLVNDYGAEVVFRRQVEALARPGDVLLALSTSGESPNVIAAAEAARENGVWVVGLTGAEGGRLAEMSDVSVKVPSAVTPRIQEAHVTVCHILCEAIEQAVAEH